MALLAILAQAERWAGAHDLRTFSDSRESRRFGGDAFGFIGGVTMGATDAETSAFLLAFADDFLARCFFDAAVDQLGILNLLNTRHFHVAGREKCEHADCTEDGEESGVRERHGVFHRMKAKTKRRHDTKNMTDLKTNLA